MTALTDIRNHAASPRNISIPGAEAAKPRLIQGLLLLLCLLGPGIPMHAEGQNLLQNPGFEEPLTTGENPPGWQTSPDSSAKIEQTEKAAHTGRSAIRIPPNSSVQQQVEAVPAGPYLASCWVKSEADQTLTFFVRNPKQPWTTYTCAEVRVPNGKWTRIETFCAVDTEGPLTVSLGGVSKEFHPYHGTTQDMASPVIVDDFELVRYTPRAPSELAVWDRGRDSKFSEGWSGRTGWTQVDAVTHAFVGMPVVQGGHMAGSVRESDGALEVYSISGATPAPRCVIVPSPALPRAQCTLVRNKDSIAVRVASTTGDRSYTASFTSAGLVHLEAKQIPEMQVQDCRMRYSLLPSFAGTDLCYAPADLNSAGGFKIPSTQWLVGLVDGNDSMLVAVWETNTQPVSLSTTGTGENQLINTLSVGTRAEGFSLAYVEHTNLWHREALQEDWLGEYVPSSWARPFPARWMGRFMVTTGGKANFRNPCFGYSFPVASAKTRMWGLWFEDWNHYPFAFEDSHLILHFEKTFVPQGEALFYFLEPAAAELSSPVEIVEKALGRERALALLDLGANQLRKLNYSTPDQFIFDRPVCATTTRLSKIKQDEKPTVGVNLVTHLYEFIREIRGRVDQYRDFFTETRNYLAEKKKEQPGLGNYVDDLQQMAEQALAQADEIYATPLTTVQTKVEKMKILLQDSNGDGFNCGNLDVRNTAGSQDDLCRRYNRFVMKMAQTAALKCGDSSEKAIIATHLWNQSQAVLRRPTRWEPRRTLYFFEP